MDQKLHSQLVMVDSKDRRPGQNPCDFEVQFNGTHRMHAIKKIALVSSAICNLFTNVWSANNVLAWEESPGVVSTYVVPSKQYNLTTLLNAMLVVPNITGITFPDGFIVIDTSIPVNWLAASTIGAVLGITADSGFVTSFTCQAPPNLSGQEIITVECDPLASNNMVTSSKESRPVLFTSSFATIPYGQWQLTESQSHILHEIEYDRYINMDTLRVRITDRQGRVLSLPDNFDVVFVLKVWTAH